jgi:hypothetical protein
MQPDYDNSSQQIPQPYSQQAPMPPPVTSTDVKRRHSGVTLLILLVVFILLFIGSAGFGLWAFSERNDYKNNTNEKTNEAVTIAVKEAEAQKDAEFAEREKQPLTEYSGPADFGSVRIKYPRTWSAFVSEDSKSTTPVDGYFHPKVVPGLKSGTAYALRVEVIEADYARELKKFDGDSKAGRVSVSPIQINNIVGARVDGQLDKNKKGSTVLFPLRDKTLRLTTESETFVPDFDNIILKELTFSP